MRRIHDWNMLVGVHEGYYKEVRELLSELGATSDTDFYNVIAMRVDDVVEILEQLLIRSQSNPEVLHWLGHIAPVTTTFTFQSPTEFEIKAKDAVSLWLPQLADKGFHIRMHRRGFKERLSSADEERLLGEFILQELERAGIPGHITFDAPDLILAIETLGQQAGLALWSRQELERYPFLHVD